MMPSTVEFEAEVIPGIEAIAVNELRTVCASQISAIRQTRAGFLRFRFSGSPGMLSALRSLVAVYQIHCFAVPRPKALLGHEHFTRMTQILRVAKARFCTAPRDYGDCRSRIPDNGHAPLEAGVESRARTSSRR